MTTSGSRGRRVPQEGGDRLEQPEARTLGLGRADAGQIGKQLAQLGEDRRELGAPAAELRRSTSGSLSRR